ncbi:MAG TPA: ABC transporter ATP-binding protein [Methanomicrobia archaeon]|nr:ABC transporter ATP-binding protein [Methanomicrobia archaeon]
MNNIIIETVDLTKIYTMGSEKIAAVDHVNLTVERNEILTIVGPSGCGKSTLLGLIGGLDKPTSGHVIFEGKKLPSSEDKLAFFRRKNIGFVFQFYNLLPALSALDNVKLPLKLLKIPDKVADERSKEILERVGLGNRFYHKPGELSGGEQQRVALARALITKPVLILADEPTGNLDSKSGDQILKLIQQMNEDYNQTFIIATHDEKISKIADRSIHLLDGRIVCSS